MADTPTADTCVCGGPHWHKLMDATYVWCRRCGALRRIFEGKWSIPLDRVGDIARSVPATSEDEIPTRPGTPGSMQKIKVPGSDPDRE